MRIVMVGAGAMGASYGGLLARSGQDVALIDTWQEHVEAINRDGLKLDDARGSHTIAIEATSDPNGLRPADLAIVLVDSNHTDQAAEAAAAVLTNDGFAITFQNGIGNVEKLQGVLGDRRVLGGSSMCSAATRGAGHVALTHEGPTRIGECDGQDSERARRLAEALNEAGLESRIERDIMTTIWTKFALNCSINAICAATGLRLGEVVRLPELDDFQHRIIDEVLAVTAAKGMTLADPDLRTTVKEHCFNKFSKPSMLQHVEAGKRIEIDALNGALVREARSLGVPVPYNEALVALVKGRELHEWRRVQEPNLNYQAWEDQISHGKGG